MTSHLVKRKNWNPLNDLQGATCSGPLVCLCPHFCYYTACWLSSRYTGLRGVPQMRRSASGRCTDGPLSLDHLPRHLRRSHLLKSPHGCDISGTAPSAHPRTSIPLPSFLSLHTIFHLLIYLIICLPLEFIISHLIRMNEVFESGFWIVICQNLNDSTSFFLKDCPCYRCTIVYKVENGQKKKKKDLLRQESLYKVLTI